MFKSQQNYHLVLVFHFPFLARRIFPQYYGHLRQDGVHIIGIVLKFVVKQQSTD